MWEIVLLPSGLFLYVDFWGVGGVYKRMFEFLFACNAMQYELYKKSKSALFVWYLMLLLFVSICNNLPEIFVIITMKSSNGSTLIYDDVCAFIQHSIQYLWTVLASVMQYLFNQRTESETNIYKKEVKYLYNALDFRFTCTWKCVRYIID